LKKRAVIIGAGPAGLTTALELLKHTDIVPVVLEKSTYMGGISRTVNYKGNRIDIGGHRFFSKSDRVTKWWLEQLRLEPNPQRGEDAVMLLRPRKSRIYFLRKFFDYPITLSVNTLAKLGVLRSIRIALSYLRSAMFPRKQVNSLEDFFINRFGRALYRTFFESYTEKVWGVPCSKISAEWGAQRVKGLSIWSAIKHFARGLIMPLLGKKHQATETSLIEEFMYPKLGPGQLWEQVAAEVVRRGGQIITEFNADEISWTGSRVTAVGGRNRDGSKQTFAADYLFSTMPIPELVNSMGKSVPANVGEVANGLVFRDFLTVGLLLKKLRISEKDGTFVQDNWIYIQEPDVKAGRLQIFNNWSPFLVKNPEHTWVGVEYFCNEGDELWSLADDAMVKLAVEELDRADILDKNDVVDATVIRVEKTYPAYFGTYERFQEIRDFVDGIENLFLIGRNGMHRYNNQDHSMLAAMTAVENIIAGRKDKMNIWQVNTESEYHETKTADETPAEAQGNKTEKAKVAVATAGGNSEQ
jgi:protoporphyrinogen oxidase